MPSLTSPVTSALCESRLVGTSHESRVTSFKSSRFTLLSENASANHLESHSCKTKDLKCPVFTLLQKKGVGEGGLFGSGHRSRAPYASPDSCRDGLRITDRRSQLTCYEPHL